MRDRPIGKGLFVATDAMEGELQEDAEVKDAKDCGGGVNHVHFEGGPWRDDGATIKRGIATRRRLAQAIYRALIGIRASIDVVVVTPEDVEALKDGVATIVGPAMREGREVYSEFDSQP